MNIYIYIYILEIVYNIFKMFIHSYYFSIHTNSKSLWGFANSVHNNVCIAWFYSKYIYIYNYS